LGHSTNGGDKLKSQPPAYDGTDNFGFSALPGGGRDFDGSFSGCFSGLGSNGRWWTAMEYNASVAYYRDTGPGHAVVSEIGTNKILGFSVRCVQD
jgi:uncharacterized protein (TIGR02145 family)